jgi:hypothetical protein
MKIGNAVSFVFAVVWTFLYVITFSWLNTKKKEATWQEYV